MKLLAEPLGAGRRVALIATAVTFAMLALLAIASRAHASETIYWDNYNASPSSIAFANVDGTLGGALNLASVEEPGTEVEISSPEGIAYDPANGRIYVASSGNDEIVWVSTDGGGAGYLDTGWALVESPEGIAVDPKTQTVYWANDVASGSIGYASAAGGGAGILNTTGASIEHPYKIALDAVNGRVYWAGEGGIVSYANLDGSGGADLPLLEAERPSSWSAINVDPSTGRLYFLESAGSSGVIYWVSTAGVGGGEIELEEPAYDGAYGMAFDPSGGRFYWANYDNAEDRENALGTTTLAPGPVTGITVATAPVSGPQDPVIVKSPTATGAPQVTASGTALNCSRGRWASDYPGSYVYGAPESYAYQWSKDGQAISGAINSAYTATASGSYSCTVTATNRRGSASQTSAAAAVTIAVPTPLAPASLTVRTASKKAVKVKAGKVAVVKLNLTNGGGTASAAVKVCAKLTKKAKKGLKAPKCVSVASIPAGGSATAKLRVKTRKTAKGLYKFTVVVKGALTASTTAKVKVLPAKGKKKRH